MLPWQEQGYQNPMGYQESPLASLVRGVPSTYYSFKGQNLKPQQNIAEQLSQLANASYDESNPIFQRLAGQERSDINLTNAANIGEYIRQNRMQGRLGRRPLFDPERGGEMLFRQQMQTLNDSSGQARERARKIIGIGQDSLNTAYTAQNDVSQAQLENNKRKASGFSNIADLLPHVLSFL